MTVKNTWLNGETVRADDLNAIATEANSGTKRVITVITGSVTIGSEKNTDYVILVDTGGAPTLPTAVGNTSRITIKNVSSTNKTVLTSSSQGIDDSVGITLRPNASVDLVSDGSGWVVI